jgi:hypothetical protein
MYNGKHTVNKQKIIDEWIDLLTGESIVWKYVKNNVTIIITTTDAENDKNIIIITVNEIEEIEFKVK